MAKQFTGIVSSNSADKTITVAVHSKKKHPVYKKQYPVTSKFIAHDEDNQCKVGDKVVISETRPISANKKFTLSKVVEKAELSEKDKQVIDSEDTAEAAQ